MTTRTNWEDFFFLFFIQWSLVWGKHPIFKTWGLPVLYMVNATNQPLPHLCHEISVTESDSLGRFRHKAWSYPSCICEDMYGGEQRLELLSCKILQFALLSFFHFCFIQPSIILPHILVCNLMSLIILMSWGCFCLTSLLGHWDLWNGSWNVSESNSSLYYYVRAAIPRAAHFWNSFWHSDPLL